jgi:hypothetical protein
MLLLLDWVTVNVVFASMTLGTPVPRNVPLIVICVAAEFSVTPTIIGTVLCAVSSVEQTTREKTASLVRNDMKTPSSESSV